MCARRSLVVAALLAAGVPTRAAEPPRLVVQTGHKDGVYTTAFSPDAKLIVTTGKGSDPTARIWDVATGREVRALQVAAGGLGSASFSPDGRHVLTTGTGAARLWDAATGAQLRALGPRGGDVQGAAFSRDGSLVALACGGSVVLADTATGTERLTIREPGMNAESVAFNRAGTRIVTGGGFEKDATIWDTKTGKRVAKLVGHTLTISAVAFSADGTRVATVGGDNTVRVWDAATAKPLHVLKADWISANSVAFDPDGARVIVGGDETATVIEVTTGKVVHKLPGHGFNGHVAYSADGKWLATAGGNKNLVRVWDAATGKEHRRFAGRIDRLSVGAFSPDGRRAVVRAGEGDARVLDLETGAQFPPLKVGIKLDYAAAFSPDGDRVLTLAEGVAVLWEATSGRELARLKGHGPVPAAVAFGADGKTLLSAGRGDGATAVVWDATTGKVVRTLQGYGDKAAALAFDPDGKRLIVGRLDNTAKIWSLETGNELHHLKGHKHFVLTVAFSPDGKHAFTGGAYEGTARVWAAETGKQLYALDLKGDAALSVRYSPDAKRLAVGGWGSALVCDAATGGARAVCNGHGGLVDPVSFTADSKFLVTGALDHTVRIWDPATGAEVCRWFRLTGGAWAVVAADGRFDASDLDESRGVNWVAVDEPFRPLAPEIFMRDYYEPKLLARVLAGEKLPPVRSVADLNRVQPLVRVAKVTPNPGAPDEVSVTVEVAGQERAFARPTGPVLVRSGASDLHLFRDGRLVALRAGPLALDPKTGRATFTFDRVKLPRAGQKGVEFSAYAFNADRVKSDTHRLAHALPVLEPRKGTAFVVCVGVNGSDEPKWDLRFAVPDAKLMGDTLAAGLKASGRYEKVVVVTLLSEPTFDKAGKRTGIESTATKAHVRAALGALAGEKPPAELVRAVPALADVRAARPEDTVILSFSTHGFNGTGGRFYLFPSDIGAGRDVTDATLRRALSTDELSDWLRGADAGELVLIADACHSAASVAADGFKPGPMGSRGLGQLAYDKRMRVLAASQADDVALEDDRVGHGLLTYALCKDGLTKNRADFDPPDGVVSVGEWLRYGVGRVPGLADEVASGKARAVSSTGRALVPVDGKQSVTQLPALFDFTRGADGPTLTGKK